MRRRVYTLFSSRIQLIAAALLFCITIPQESSAMFRSRLFLANQFTRVTAAVGPQFLSSPDRAGLLRQDPGAADAGVGATHTEPVVATETHCQQSRFSFKGLNRFARRAQLLAQQVLERSASSGATEESVLQEILADPTAFMNRVRARKVSANSDDFFYLEMIPTLKIVLEDIQNEIYQEDDGVWSLRLQEHRKRGLVLIQQGVPNSKLMQFLKDYIHLKSRKDAATPESAGVENLTHSGVFVFPTFQKLSKEDVLRLFIPHNLCVLGLTQDPAEADGIMRDTHDFFVHDYGHFNLVQQLRRLMTQNVPNLPEVELNLFRHLDEKMKTLSSNERNAVIAILFETLHEHARPLTPDNIRRASTHIQSRDISREELRAALAWLKSNLI